MTATPRLSVLTVCARSRETEIADQIPEEPCSIGRRQRVAASGHHRRWQVSPGKPSQTDGWTPSTMYLRPAAPP